MGNDRWEGTAPLTPQFLEYKFTLAAWPHEALDAQGQKRPNAALSVQGLVHVQDTVLAWSDANTTRRVVGQVTGQLDNLGVKEAEGLLPREVWVWTPPQTAPPTAIGRVLVMHDGQNVVDPATSSFGVDWGVDEVLDSLVRAGILPRTLLVAVACTADRSAEYGPGRRGARYVDWLMTELVPDICGQYNVPEDVSTTVAGASMGGLISFIAAERHPELVDAAICMSPAFGYARFNYADSLKARGWGGHGVPLWIDNGTVGLEEQLQPGVNEMERLAQGLHLDHVVKVFDGAKHFESDWGRRMPEALNWVESAWTHD
jgi:enterochelin esterase-like enzyme